ncbi:MAG: DUF2029 domain-containing protein [Muribaculaceae bacterium]|nr:DUF2029 domain-containing protein [Muribaculaceae bacterium]
MNNHSDGMRDMRIERGEVFNLVLWVLTVTGMGVFLIGMPKYCDDWWYMERLRGWFESQGVWYPTDGGDILSAGIPWPDIAGVWKDHIMTDNSRLCNILVVPFLLLPKWVGSTLALAAWVYAMWGSFRLAGADWRRSPLVPAAFALWSFLLPWREQAGALDYQFNYVLTSALAVSFLLLLRRGDSRRVWPCAVCGLLLGAWQEAFAAPIFCALIALVLFCRECRTRRYMWAVAGLGVGLLWLAAAPGLRVRIGGEVLTARFSFYRAALMFLQHPAFCLMTVMAVIALCREGWRKLVSDRFLLLLLISAAVPLVMAFASNAMRRTGWWSDMASVIGIMMLVRILWGARCDRYSAGSAVAGLLLSVLTVAHLLYVDIYTVRISRQMRELLAQWHADPERQLFADITDETRSPAICFFMPDFTLFTYNWNVISANNYYSGHKGTMGFRVIPDTLRDIRAGEGEPVAGDSGIRLCRGYLVRAAEKDTPRAFNADIDFGIWKRADVSMHCYAFTSEADGTRFEVVYPQEATLEQIIGCFSRIDVK